MPFLSTTNHHLFYTDTPPHPPTISPRATLLLTHGLGSTSSYYHPLIPALTSAPHHYRCIAFDTTGQGQSPYTQIEQSIATLAADVIGVLDALKVQKAVVVGHSMGAVVAPYVAERYPERVVGAVLLGPVLPSPAAREGFERRIEAVRKDGMEAIASTIPTAATGSRSTPLQHAFIRALLMSQPPAGYVSMCRVIGSATPPDYARIRAPVLIVAGEEDKSAPLKGCEEILRRVGAEEKRMVVLKGVGHWLCIESPEEVVEAVAGFCEGVI